MTFDAFIGLWLFSFLLSYALLIIFNGIREIFPHEPSAGLRIDFKNYD